MPSTTPDFSTVTVGVGSAGAEGGAAGGAGGGCRSAATLTVDSAGASRLARRCGGTSGDRARSGFGQASSKLAGGTSPASAALGATGGGARRSPGGRLAGACRRPLAILAHARSEQQVTPRLDRRRGRGLGLLDLERRIQPRARGGILMPGRRGGFCLRRNGRRLIARKDGAVVALGLGSGERRQRRRLGARFAGWTGCGKPAANQSQFPCHDRQAEQNHPGAEPDRARQNQGVAEAELLDRYPDADRHQADQNGHDASDLQDDDHPLHLARNARPSPCHDTVILYGMANRHLPRRPGKGIQSAT